ncbi:hypothetical protein LINPERHAP1_LOCUS31566 [Linum perenne]
MTGQRMWTSAMSNYSYSLYSQISIMCCSSLTIFRRDMYFLTPRILIATSTYTLIGVTKSRSFSPVILMF